jgi:hypothetical protein
MTSFGIVKFSRYTSGSMTLFNRSMPDGSVPRIIVMLFST